VAVARVQQKEASASGTSVPTTLPSTPGTGNLLIVRTVSVATGRTHTLSGSGWLTAVSNSRVSIFYKIAGASEPNTITFSCSGGSTTLYVQADEYSGMVSSSPLDVVSSSTGTGSTGTSGTTATTTVATALAIAVWGLGGTSGTTTPVFTNTFTADWESAANAARVLGRKILSATGTQTSTATWTTSRSFHSGIAVFKGATGGSSITAVTLTTTPVLAWVPEQYQDGFGNASGSKLESHVHAAALTASPTLPTASVAAVKLLTAATITVTPTFPQATVNATKVVSAAVLTTTPTLPVANLTRPVLAATITVVPALPAAEVVNAVTVIAVPLSVTPTMPAAALTGSITAVTLTASPTLNAAVVTIPLFAATLTVVPDQPAAEVTIDTEALAAALLTITPTLFPAAAFSFGVAPDTLVEVPTLPAASLLVQSLEPEIPAPSGVGSKRRHRGLKLGLRLRD
jgi:hypothetical protein